MLERGLIREKGLLERRGYKGVESLREVAC